MRIIYILLSLFIYNLSTAQLFNPQSKKITATHFPEMNMESPTPAFHNRKGYTRYEEMLSFINNLRDKHPSLMQISFIGNTQKGRMIPLIKINKGDRQDKVRVWIQAGIHGDEPASTEGVLYLIYQLLELPQYGYLLDKLEIGILPMGNIDGFQLQERTANNGLDLNRDQTKLLIPESVYLKQAFSDFKAEVALDFHEYNPFRSDYQQMGKAGYTLPHDVMFLYSGNLNIGPTLRKYTEESFVNKAKDDLNKKGLKTFDYFTPSEQNGYTQYNLGSINARASATSFALTNCISTLFEVRGVSLGKTSFNRRTLTTFYLALSYLESAYQNASELKQVLKKSLTENDKITVLSESETIKEDFPFLDLATNKIVNESVLVKNALRSKPILQRDIPVAYILMPEQVQLVNKLKVFGIEFTPLENELRLKVTKYKVNKYRRESLKFENVYRQYVSTETSEIEKVFPQGSYVVYTEQKNRGLLFELLEPEATNSLTAYHIISTNLNEELPIYRYSGNKL